jgi:acylphosphatase
VRKRVVVHGQAQGVGFRYAVARRAAASDVAGWVRNLPDGTVEAVFEGEPARVESLVRFCRDGPRGARVDHIEVRTEPDTSLAGFEVR